jgi:hypothetical protein
MHIALNNCDEIRSEQPKRLYDGVGPYGSLREARVGAEDVNTQQEQDVHWRAPDTIVQSTFLHTRGLILKSFRKEG